MTFVVLMDFSFSISAHLTRLRAAVEHFLKETLPGDTGQVGSASIDLLGSTNGHRAIVVFTDGMDTASRLQ